MSEFLLIVPEGWTQIDFDAVYSMHGDFSEANVDNWCATTQWSYIEAILKEVGALPESAIVVEARRFQNYMLVRLG
jgi:hypothetical protein